MKNRLALAALVCLLPALAGPGCQIHASQHRVYRDGKGEIYPKPDAPEPQPIRAPKRNELVAGVKKFRLVTGAEEDEHAGDVKDIGRNFVEALLDAKIFKEVHYPLRDEKIDVELEPIVRLDLVKNRFTNAIKVFPGLIFQWIDGFGFDYDHTIALELRVRDANRPDVICDTYRSEAKLTAERYPSILWLCGLHAGLFILLVFETVTTDTAVCEKLAETNAEQLERSAITWLLEEFAPTARGCPDHPSLAGNTGKFCVICRKNLRYPILNRGGGAGGPEPPGAPAPTTPTADVKNS